jgi:hypothetical protein
MAGGQRSRAVLRYYNNISWKWWEKPPEAFEYEVGMAASDRIFRETKQLQISFSCFNLRNLQPI